MLLIKWFIVVSDPSSFPSLVVVVEVEVGVAEVDVDVGVGVIDVEEWIGFIKFDFVRFD